MKISHILASSLLFSALCWANSPELLFNPDPLPLDTLQQGSVRHVVLKGKNTSQRKIDIETVMSQNTGAENFKYPKTLTPGQEFKIEFDLNTAFMEGPFTHRIITVENDGKPHVALVEGVVETQIRFSQQILDIGYYQAGEKREWTLYAWNPKGKSLTLNLQEESAKQFQIKTQSVKINTEKFDEIKEGGKTPGLRITLTLKDLGKAPPQGAPKSIRQLISFHSPEFAKATPELFMVGYWKP